MTCIVRNSTRRTSVAAFIGVAEKGPLGGMAKVFNSTEYQNHCGGFPAQSFLSHAVFQFFNTFSGRVSEEQAASGTLTHGHYRHEYH